MISPDLFEETPSAIIFLPIHLFEHHHTSHRQGMMENNPEMRALMDSNPELRNMLQDPEIMRQSMQMMRDPSAMQNMLRQQDLAMSVSVIDNDMPSLHFY